MTDTSTDPRLSDIDGFRVEIDPDRQRGDIILSRPPMNVIWMGQRDQLRVAFEELDTDDRVRGYCPARRGGQFLIGRLHQRFP